MRVINTHYAKTYLSKILDDVSHGAEFIIGKAGKPIAKLVPIQQIASIRTGAQLKGKIFISDDFDELPDSFSKHFILHDKPKIKR